MRPRIAAGCATEGYVLDQQALAELEEGLGMGKATWVYELGGHETPINCSEGFSRLRPHFKIPQSENQEMDDYAMDAVFEPLKMALSMYTVTWMACVIQRPEANFTLSEGLNITVDWEESSLLLQKAGIPRIPTDVNGVDDFIPIGAFIQSQPVRFPPKA